MTQSEVGRKGRERKNCFGQKERTKRSSRYSELAGGRTHELEAVWISFFHEIVQQAWSRENGAIPWVEVGELVPLPGMLAPASADRWGTVEFAQQYLCIAYPLKVAW